MKNKDTTPKNKSEDNKDFPGYPIYPPSEDIYNQNKEESEIDPEDTSKVKPSSTNEGKSNIKDFNEDKSENTGYTCVKWLCDYILDNNINYHILNVFIHTQNPIGAKNIKCYFENFNNLYWKKQRFIRILKDQI